MKSGVKALFIFLLFVNFGFSQTPDWTLKFSSVVEKDDQPCSGAMITVLSGSTKVATAVTSSDGYFMIEVPPNGNFMVTISKDGCNTKKFSVNTTGVPADMNKNNFKAIVKVEGVTMSKPLPTIDYSALSQPMTQISYDAAKKKFTDDEAYTNSMLGALTKIREAERILLEKYAAANKAGDQALAKNDCENAKLNYANANKLLPDEQYPKDQLIKAENCAKAKEDEKRKAEEAAAAKLAAEKAAADKAKIGRAHV